MIRSLLLFALLAAPAALPAQQRTIGVGSFDRVRIDGPFDVVIDTGRSPAATIQGDRDAAEAIDIRVDGTTLVVHRAINAWGERPDRAASTATVVRLATPVLTAVTAIGGGTTKVGRMKGARIDLALTGGGVLAVAAAEGPQVNATVIGSGGIVVAGQATRARLLTNGPGTIDAAKLDTGDLTIRLDGAGTTKAAARYTAQVTNVGSGAVIVAGPAKCTVRALAGGPVRCGVEGAP